MHRTRQRPLLTSLTISGTLLLGGCKPDAGTDDTGTPSTSGAATTGGEGSTISSEDPGVTTGGTGATHDITGIMGEESGTATTMDSGDSSSDEGGDPSGDPVMCDPLVDPTPVSDTPCEADADCPDGEFCDSFANLGGMCGACKTDADCPDHGCTHNWMHGHGAQCNTGELGAGCESDAACQACAAHCAVISELFLGNPDPIVTRTCSPCADNADCPGGQACTVLLDEARIGGFNLCVAAGSLPDGDTCRLVPDGGLACASGICAEINDHGVSRLGVCGECAADADCAQNEVCTPGGFDQDDLLLPKCEPA